jgi:hypothetical protein
LRRLLSLPVGALPTTVQYAGSGVLNCCVHLTQQTNCLFDRAWRIRPAHSFSMFTCSAAIVGRNVRSLCHLRSRPRGDRDQGGIVPGRTACFMYFTCTAMLTPQILPPVIAHSLCHCSAIAAPSRRFADSRFGAWVTLAIKGPLRWP